MAFTSVCKRGELQWNLDHSLASWCVVNVKHSQIQHDGQENLGRRHSFVTTAGQEISLSTIRYASSCLLSWTMQGREKTWSWEVSESLRYWFNSLFAWKSPWSSPAVKRKNCDFLYIWSWDSVGFVAGWTSEPSVIGHFVSTLLFGGQKKIDTVQLWHDCLAFIFYNLSFAKANIDQHPLHPPFFSQTNNFSHFLNFF